MIPKHLFDIAWGDLAGVFSSTVTVEGVAVLITGIFANDAALIENEIGQVVSNHPHLTCQLMPPHPLKKGALLTIEGQGKFRIVSLESDLGTGMVAYALASIAH